MKNPSQKKKGLWIVGVNSVQEALLNDRLPGGPLFVCRNNQRIDEIILLAEQRNIPIQIGTHDALTSKVGNAQHQGEKRSLSPIGTTASLRFHIESLKKSRWFRNTVT